MSTCSLSSTSGLLARRLFAARGTDVKRSGEAGAAGSTDEELKEPRSHERACGTSRGVGLAMFGSCSRASWTTPVQSVAAAPCCFCRQFESEAKSRAQPGILFRQDPAAGHSHRGLAVL